MAKGTYKSIKALCKRLKNSTDAMDAAYPNDKRVTLLYACNASGKTQVSKYFYDDHESEALYYSAFTEDLFTWDNDNYVLKIPPNSWLAKLIQTQGLEPEIISNYQKFSGSKVEPSFFLAEGKITFARHTGATATPENMKISRGEESAFIWSTFYTVLDSAIDALNEPVGARTVTDFDAIKYVLIDDPVSSMDDTRIITIAISLADLISKSNNQLRFLITTHHALFFNVLFTATKWNKNRNSYILSKSETDYRLKRQGNESPFAYHHVVIAEIRRAISGNEIKKYHFNLYRALLEKTANFLGHERWKDCLKDDTTGETLIKLIDHYSHNGLSDLDAKDLPVTEREDFSKSFNFFMSKFNWGAVANG